MDNIVPFPVGKKSEEQRFEAFIRPHASYIYRLAFRFYGRKAEAEDLTQEVLIKAFEQSKFLMEIEKPQAWLARVTHNTYVDQVRRAVRSPLTQGLGSDTDDDVVVGLSLVSESDTLDTIGQDERHSRLMQALEQLSPERRAIIALHDIEGYTLAELEGMLETPLGTLKSRLHRGRQELREILGMSGTFSEE